MEAGASPLRALPTARSVVGLPFPQSSILSIRTGRGPITPGLVGVLEIWCSGNCGSILGRGVADRVLPLAAVWRTGWQELEGSGNSDRKLLGSSQAKLNDRLEWGGGSEVRSREWNWTVLRRSDGLGGGLDLGAEGEGEGGVKDDWSLLVYKIGWWHLPW